MRNKAPGKLKAFKLISAPDSPCGSDQWLSAMMLCTTLSRQGECRSHPLTTQEYCLVRRFLLIVSLCLLPIVAVGEPVKSLLPSQLEGQTFLFTVDSTPSPDNPNASVSYLMRFAKDTYEYQIIGSGKVLTGKFHYTVYQDKLGPIGVISATELFDGVESTYKMVLVPKNKTTGLYLFKQITGAIKPNVRMNSARYTRIIVMQAQDEA